MSSIMIRHRRARRRERRINKVAASYEEQYTINDMRSEASERGLSTDGSTEDLARRLARHDVDAGGGPR